MSQALRARLGLGRGTLTEVHQVMGRQLCVRLLAFTLRAGQPLTTIKVVGKGSGVGVVLLVVPFTECQCER